jgi:hypothetical protein
MTTGGGQMAWRPLCGEPRVRPQTQLLEPGGGGDQACEQKRKTDVSVMLLFVGIVAHSTE